jgi:hypothetical protein
MRLDLQTTPSAYVKQVADLRRFLNREDAKGGQAVVGARFLTAALVPFLPALRTELRQDAVDPHAIMTATSDLVSNLVMTVIESLFDARWRPSGRRAIASWVSPRPAWT